MWQDGWKAGVLSQVWRATGLRKLDMLKLEHNQITTIQANVFSDLTVLNSLNIEHNHITNISDRAFAGLESEWLGSLVSPTHLLSPVASLLFSTLLCFIMLLSFSHPLLHSSVSCSLTSPLLSFNLLSSDMLPSAVPALFCSFLLL